MPNFRSALKQNQILLFDGALGTMLQARGLPPGQTPEEFGLESPQVLQGIYAEYRRAGVDVLTTNTFGGNRFKLSAGRSVRDLNRTFAALARQAAGDELFVAGSVGPSGHFLRPMGDLSFQELVDAYADQIAGLVEGGADLILAETHLDLAEARAVVYAARQVTALPIGVSMTFEQGRTCLTGTSPLTFLDTMQNMGVDLIAINCGTPEDLSRAVESMLPRLRTPLLVEPNAGLPEIEGGRTVFRLTPESFADQLCGIADLGAACLGGCCGTTPDHIAALRQALAGKPRRAHSDVSDTGFVLTSRTASVPVGVDMPTVVIGERINPTGKKRLTEEFQAGQFSLAFVYAEEQVGHGAGVLDVNVGAPLVDEASLLPELVLRLAERVAAPLCLDSSNPQALMNALETYPGSALVNSITGDAGRMEQLGPLCRDMGAPFILLPLRGRTLPVTATERIAIIESLLDQAETLGIPRRLILVDVLALTISSRPDAARHCLETIRHCRDAWRLPTSIGLSNISFGLPARELLNATFLTMCIAQGLSACIADPGAIRIKESRHASELLLNRDPSGRRFIPIYAEWTPGGTDVNASAPSSLLPVQGAAGVYQAVLTGNTEGVVSLVEEELAKGTSPTAIVDTMLIPAITDVGTKYEKKEYFLPQLLLSAETMQTAFARLKPLLEESPTANRKNVIVMATVEGDIHDIGKNIVCLMLRNRGFEVVDLGKDVPAKTIVEKASECGADIIGLSALMTTTMVKMGETVDLVRKQGLPCKVLVGGAVVTEQFAASIGADGCARDAVSAVKLALDLCKQVASRD